jgi:hypothetical protein
VWLVKTKRRLVFPVTRASVDEKGLRQLCSEPRISTAHESVGFAHLSNAQNLEKWVGGDYRIRLLILVQINSAVLRAAGKKKAESL